MRKTAIIKDRKHPIFDEKLQYKNISISAVQTTTLEVSVIDRKVIFPKNQSVIGKCSIELRTLETSNVEKIDWYNLFK